MLKSGAMNFWSVGWNLVTYLRTSRSLKSGENVRDYGHGIPEAELPHVKEKFYKGSSKNRGTGIGLAVCDEIVNRHGGTLTISNAPGKEGGCLVSVTLPVSAG